MTRRKANRERGYPPRYVSTETLAYLLDCSPSTIDAYVQAGLLPSPMTIGNIVRFDFEEVREFLANRFGAAAQASLNNQDAYLEALANGSEE